MEDEAYGGIWDNFASELGSTLEELVSDWTEADVEYARSVEIDSVVRRSGVEDSSRTSSFLSQISMSSLDGIGDLSLKKARPLYFTNPVYALINKDGTASKSHQLTLIPLSQFEINKPKDESAKPPKKKRGSHGLINKLSHFTMRKHSVKRQEPEIEVTAPLWTDVPSMKLSDAPRSSSLRRTPSEVERAPEFTKEKVTPKPRPHSLDIEDDVKQHGSKQVPPKLPRTSKGGNSPLTPKVDQFSPPTQAENNVFTTECNQPEGCRVEIVPLSGDTEKVGVKSASSCGSLSSDLSDDNNLEDEELAKTMMEVMNEVGDDSAVDEAMNQQKTREEFEEKRDDQPLKRNKTLKWSGSRAAPALIREFTKKSRKNRQEDNNISVDSPGISVENSPLRYSESDAETRASSHPATPAKDSKLLKADRLPIEMSASAPTTPNMNRRDASAFTVLSALLPPAPKLKRTESSKIRLYIHRMGTNVQNALGYATSQFINQTINSAEYRPVVLLHSIRSFLTDIKRYLVSNPHVGFMTKIQKIVKHSPVSDVEGAIDDALERLVLYPLRDHIYKRLVIEYARSGKIKNLEDAIKVAKTKTPKELGIRETIIPPGDEAMEEINNHFLALQSTYSPFLKLKHLLSAVTTIYQNTSDLTCEDHSAKKIGADDFLPLLVYAIVKCDFTAADIEAQYVDGLLDPTLLLGEGGYYLTTMISAVQVLSSMKRREASLPNISDLQGFLKVGISSKKDKSPEQQRQNSVEEGKDEDAGQSSLLLHKTLHVPPSMTAHNLGMMIAKKYGMKNPKNYCLHVVVNGVAYPLRPQEFPQLVKMDLLTQFSASSFYFIYRQIENSPSRSKSPERPVTMDTEHLKINTEDGAAETLPPSPSAVEETVAGAQTTIANIPEDETPPGDVDLPPPEDVDLPPSEDVDLPPPENVDLPPPGDDLPAPDDVDLPAPECDDLPPPEDVDLPPPDDVQLLPPEVNDLPAPEVGDLSQAKVNDLPLLNVDNLTPAFELLSPQRELAKRNSDLMVTTPYDSEDEIPPFLETYEAGDLVDMDIATSVTTASTSKPTKPKRSNKGRQATAVSTAGNEETTRATPKSQVLNVPITQSVTTATISQREDLGESPQPPSSSSSNSTDEDSESEYSSDYDNLQESTEVPEEPPKIVAEPTQDTDATQCAEVTNEPTKVMAEVTTEVLAGDVELKPDIRHDHDASDQPSAPSVTITDLCETTDPNNNGTQPSKKISESSDRNSCHSEGFLETGSVSDDKHSKGYHSDGAQVDEVFPPPPANLGAEASVTQLKMYFEEKIIEVAQTTITKHT